MELTINVFIAFMSFYYVAATCEPNCLIEESISGYTVTVQHCPPGWVRYADDKCFKLFTTFLTPAAAETACQAQDSTLAAVATYEELRFLNSYIAREVKVESMTNVWLGGRKLGGENLWFWTDLSTFSYTHWWPGHPDFKQGFCVGLVTGNNYINTHPNLWGMMGTWSCEASVSYICQKFQKDAKRFIKVRS